MNEANSSMAKRIKSSFGVLLLTFVAGCLGYVDGGYGGAVVVPEPDLFLFGGGYYGDGYYERGRDVHEYSHRGAASRASAHASGGGHARNR